MHCNLYCCGEELRESTFRKKTAFAKSTSSLRRVVFITLFVIMLGMFFLTIFEGDTSRTNARCQMDLTGLSEQPIQIIPTTCRLG
jgi:hypothetical protein